MKGGGMDGGGMMGSGPDFSSMNEGMDDRFTDDIAFMGSNPMSMSPTQRRDMRGPEGVDDIINELQNEP